MAVNRFTGQTTIDPLAGQLFQQALTQQAPNVTGGFLGPIAQTAAGLFREKRAVEGQRELAKERAGILQGVDFKNPDSIFGAVMQLQMRGGADDLRQAQQLMQFGGQRQSMELADRADARADTALQMQAQQQQFVQSMRVKEFNANSGHRAAMLGLKRAQLNMAREAAANEMDPIQKAVAMQRAKDLEKEGRLAGKIERELTDLVGLGRELGQEGPRALLNREKVANFESAKVALVNRWATFINNGNEPTREMVQSLLDQVSGTLGLVAGVDAGKIDGFAKTVLGTLGATPEQRAAFLGGGGEVTAAPAAPAAPAASGSGNVIDFRALQP